MISPNRKILLDLKAQEQPSGEDIEYTLTSSIVVNGKTLDLDQNEVAMITVSKGPWPLKTRINVNFFR